MEEKEMKKLTINYLANKLAIEANKVWEEKKWTNDDMDKFLNTHMRSKIKK